VVVVPEGIAPMFEPATPAAIDAVRHRLGITRPFLLAVGAFDPRKRIQLLADVVRRVRSRHDVELVIAGEQGNFLWPVRGARAAAAMADAVCAILDDDSGRARRAVAGREWTAKFTWQRAAQLTFDVYKQAIRS